MHLRGIAHFKHFFGGVYAMSDVRRSVWRVREKK